MLPCIPFVYFLGALCSFFLYIAFYLSKKKKDEAMPFMWGGLGKFEAHLDPLPLGLGSLGCHYFYFWWYWGSAFLGA